MKSISREEIEEMAKEEREEREERANQLDRFYFTFYSSHPFAKKYVIIFAPNLFSARKIMFEVFGQNWAFAYTQKDWILENGQSQAEKYKYELLTTLYKEGEYIYEYKNND